MRKKTGMIMALLLITALAVPLLSSAPVLAAASVASITETAFGSDTTGHNVTMPAAVNSGDLLIVLFANDGNATVTTPGGWILLTSNSSSAAVRLSAYYKIAAGTENSTLVNFVTSAAEQAAAQVYRITSWHGTTPPEISSNASSSTTPNPPYLNPSGWDVEETLWIAVAGVDGTPSGGTSYPASYGNGTRTESGGGQSCMVISANRILTAASEDPGQFTNGDGAKDWVACTIAVRPSFTTYNLTMAVAPGGSGNATDLTNASPYTAGTVVNITAVAAAGYRFANWTAPAGVFGNANAAATNFTMPAQNVTATANFVAVYNLTMAVAPGGSGNATDVTNASPYTAGTVVNITAVAAAGYYFANWTAPAGVFGNANAASTNFTMPAQNVTVTANFEMLSCNLTVNSDGCCPIDLSWCFDSANVTAGGNKTFTGNDIPYGFNVWLTAVNSTCCVFDYWTGNVTGAPNSTNPIEVTMEGAKNVTAHCHWLSYNLTVVSDGCCPITVGTLGSVDADDSHTFTDIPCGTNITLTADDSGLSCMFVHWEGDVPGCINSTNPITITMDNNKTVAGNCTTIPGGEATDSGGATKDVFTTSETVYASGSGFTTAQADIYVFPERNWLNGDNITSLGLVVVSSALNVPIVAGNLAPTIVWAPPLTVGYYDILIDANENGVYDAGIDAVDDWGFEVIGAVAPVGGTAYPINKLIILLPWMALAAAVAVGIAILARRRRAHS
jgi:hypothetical protein